MWLCAARGSGCVRASRSPDGCNHAEADASLPLCAGLKALHRPLARVVVWSVLQRSSEAAVRARRYWQLFRVLEGRRSGAGAAAAPDVRDVALPVSTLSCTAAFTWLKLLSCSQPACDLSQSLAAFLRGVESGSTVTRHSMLLQISC